MTTEHQTIAKPEREFEFISDFDLHLLREGTHSRLYDKLGAHRMTQNGTTGTHFAVWAPNARRVYVAGDFNHWDRNANPLSQCGQSGIWAGFVPEVNAGSAYSYHVVSMHQGYRVDKTDPFGFRQEGPPRPASYVWDLHHKWQDEEWMATRHQKNSLEAPIAIYEVHLESWMRVPEEGNRWLSYREIAPKLAEHVRRLGFTHVELLPVMEHPLSGARDHEITGFYAPTARWGTPQDLMFLIEHLHQNGIGVILDWVPAHLPADEQGLSYFDGELGEWAVNTRGDDLRRSFDYGRGEVRSFLLSNAFFWLDVYHADGLRANSVSSVLYLDYGRKPGEWVPNAYGGRENLEGIDFLRQFNAEVYRHFPGAQTIAEERTGWPSVSRPTYVGGMGFGFKWDTDFTQDTLQYFSRDPLFRKFHHHALASGDRNAFDENVVLGFPHCEVQGGKSSLLARMAGDEWQRFANLRLMFGYQYLLPGKKLLFMGAEFAQWQSWNHDTSLDWHLQAHAPHTGMQHWVSDLNRFYRSEPPLHQSDCNPAGFEWVDSQDAEQSTLSWLRRDPQRRHVLLAVCNFTPVVRRNFRVGVRRAGTWREVLNSDAIEYSGSGQGNLGRAATAPFRSHGFPHMLTITLPPLSLVVFKHEG
jgi:1,4-alpha-glucan branching enzyme